MKNEIEIEFFHDVVCAFCYVLSPKLRRLAEDNSNIEVIHRSFVLSSTHKDMALRFGSLEKAKNIILQHWDRANSIDDEHRINTELMRSRHFDYPYSMPGLKACVAAKLQGGDLAYWDYFDLIQKTHLTDAINIADEEVLFELSKKMNLDVTRFKDDYEKNAEKIVIEDIQRSEELEVHAVPTLIVNGTYKVSGAVQYEELEKLIKEI